MDEQHYAHVKRDDVIVNFNIRRLRSTCWVRLR